jgi:DNA-binding HxlR family transcriptional regulator
VEVLGDRWSPLIIRDMRLHGARSYKTFLQCYEGIATNILADRLRKLAAYGIITTKPYPSDGHQERNRSRTSPYRHGALGSRPR